MNKIASYAFFSKNLPEELIPVLISYCDPETDYYREKIKNLISNKRLSLSGFESNHAFNIDNHLANIISCMKQIPSLITPKRVYKVSSYEGKHAIEMFRSRQGITDTYISNGEFIIAMLLLGHPYRHSSGPNCSFKAGFLPA